MATWNYAGTVMVGDVVSAQVHVLGGGLCAEVAGEALLDFEQREDAARGEALAVLLRELDGAVPRHGAGMVLVPATGGFLVVREGGGEENYLIGTGDHDGVLVRLRSSTPLDITVAFRDVPAGMRTLEGAVGRRLSAFLA